MPRISGVPDFYSVMKYDQNWIGDLTVMRIRISDELGSIPTRGSHYQIVDSHLLIPDHGIDSQ